MQRLLPKKIVEGKKKKQPRGDGEEEGGSSAKASIKFKHV